MTREQVENLETANSCKHAREAIEVAMAYCRGSHDDPLAVRMLQLFADDMARDERMYHDRGSL